MFDPLLGLMKTARKDMKVFMTVRNQYAFNDAGITERLGLKGYISLERHQDA